ncbi:MAG: histidine kinase [Lachnospiraceae bacterium]|nr:histidine kinase [Lachnospiraceae bacterium]
MKRKVSGTNRFVRSTIALSLAVVTLWVIFYVLMIRMVRGNMRLQAETGAGAITSAVEEELCSMEDTAFNLARLERVTDMVQASRAKDLLDAGGRFLDENPILPGNIRNDDSVVVFRADGLFYRLKGNMPNTTLKRVFYLCENGGNRTLTVASNGLTYIGAWEEIWTDGKKTGYVAILTGLGRIRGILEAYNDLDYLGVVLLSGEEILFSNKEIRYEELPAIAAESVFSKEKEIGLSGFRLFVYCERSFSGQVSTYFRRVLPIMILILVVMILMQRQLYRSEVGRREAELERERSLLSLLKKQISAHFTVNTLNVVRAMIKKGEKEPAAHICDELSTLLRYANGGEAYISLLEEFYVLRQYVGIMQARYPGKIDAEIEEEDFFDEVYIPRMLLQPVVENAIQHGLGGGGGKIRVSAVRVGEDIDVSVEDNGSGMSEEKLAELEREINSPAGDEKGELQHVALRNIQRRIRMVCGEGYGISVRSKEGEGTEMRLHLPGKGKESGDEEAV